MTAKGHQWADRELSMTEVRLRLDFQVRAAGINHAHANKLLRALKNGEALPRVKVAAIGKALYLVDGFHRHAAHAMAKRDTIKAKVARMSLGEARAVAQEANTRHGKGLSRADKQKLWDEYASDERYRDDRGALKSLRAIETDLGSQLSRETIRKRLKDIGLEGELEPVKARRVGDEDPAFLADERALEAEVCLRSFGELLGTLENDRRAELLALAWNVLSDLECGKKPSLLHVSTPDNDAALLGV